MVTNCKKKEKFWPVFRSDTTGHKRQEIEIAWWKNHLGYVQKNKENNKIKQRQLMMIGGHSD